MDRAALPALARDEEAAARVTLMVDSADPLDLLDDVLPPGRRPQAARLPGRRRLAASAGGRGHVGVRRSPGHSPADAVALARRARPGVRLAGLMAYEAQIAGMQDAPAGRPLRGVAVRAMQLFSTRELAARRAAVVAAVTEVAPLEFVNGGGTRSLERTGAEDAVTELAAGSGLYSPALFDGYRAFTGRPAAFFGLPVTRVVPAPGVVTVAGNGWIASSPPGPRCPRSRPAALDAHRGCR